MKFRAMEFSIKKHGEQKRKYTGDPYWKHCAEVAAIVDSIENEFQDIVICSAWLHDTIEDCNVSFEEIKDNFSIHIAQNVLMLSDLEEGNRESRKKLSRERLSKANKQVQDIKVADLISNTSSIVIHDPKFAKIYLQEKMLLLDALTKADKRLISIARNQCKI